jgi:hypothetical protein
MCCATDTVTAFLTWPPWCFDVQSGHFSVQDFLDFDPKKKPNPLPRKRPQFALANAIDTAFHADRVGPTIVRFESQSAIQTTFTKLTA